MFSRTVVGPIDLAISQAAVSARTTRILIPATQRFLRAPFEPAQAMHFTPQPLGLAIKMHVSKLASLPLHGKLTPSNQSRLCI
jgi:hypothetical protein